MQRWLVPLCALALVPAAAARAGTSLPPCVGNLRLTVETEGESTTSRIGVSIRNNDRRACRVSLPVSVTIIHANARARVTGNPLQHRPLRVLRAGDEEEVLVADWQNWCSGRTSNELVVSYGGLVTRQSVPVLPACLQKRRPSRLLLVR